MNANGAKSRTWDAHRFCIESGTVSGTPPFNLFDRVLEQRPGTPGSTSSTRKFQGMGGDPRQNANSSLGNVRSNTKRLGCSCNLLLARAAPRRYSLTSSNPPHFRVLNG